MSDGEAERKNLHRQRRVQSVATGFTNASQDISVLQEGASRPPVLRNRGVTSADVPNAMYKQPRVRFCPPPTADEISRLGSKSGYLKKQADNEPGAWNQYFFVLRPSTCLYYYKSESDDHPRGVLDLQFMEEVKLNSDCLQRSVGGSDAGSFRVAGRVPSRLKDSPGKPKLRPIYLDANDENDAHEWMRAIEEHRFSVSRMHEAAMEKKQLAECQETIKVLNQELQKTSSRMDNICGKARRLLASVRGLDVDSDEMNAPKSLRFADEPEKMDMMTKLETLEMLLGDFHAEADHQAKQVTTLRERNEDTERKLQNAIKLSATRKSDEASDPATIFSARARRSRSVFSRGVEPEHEERTSFRQMDDTLAASEDENDEESAEVRRDQFRTKRSRSDVKDLYKLAKNGGKFLSKKVGKSSKDESDLPSTRSATSELESFNEKDEEMAEEEEMVEAQPSPGIASSDSDDLAFPAPRQRKKTIVSALTSRVKLRSKKSKKNTVETPQTETPDPYTDVENKESPSTEHSTPDELKALPDGWKRHESRTMPGEYYYAHYSGYSCWEYPTDQELKEAEELAEAGMLAPAEDWDDDDESEVATDDTTEDAKPKKRWNKLNAFAKKKMIKPRLPRKARSPKDSPPPSDEDEYSGHHVF